MKNELSKAMQDKAMQVANAVDALMEQTKDWQMIKQFLTNRITDIELTETQHEKLKRYKSIYSELLSNKYEESELPAMISKMHNISLAQSYRDLRDAKELWSKVIKVDKLFEVRLAIDGCKRMMRKAEEMNDVMAYSMIDKVKQKYLSMLPDEIETMTEGWMAPEIEPVFDPALLGVDVNIDMKGLLEKINNKRNAKINTELFEEAIVVQDDTNE